jgi:hypothetical protein
MQLILEYFFLSLFLTMFILYITCPSPKIILKYPNVKDSTSDLYIDDNNICYRYHRKEIECK